jgi:4-diphosphocytidyl-2-C-methyl-D-erythritol kinase
MADAAFASGEAVVLGAPAKLTLNLEVVGVRSDGYHELRAEMVSVGLFDTLELRPGDGLEVVDAVRWWGTAPSSPPESADGAPPNLVLRALALAKRRADVRLTKRIPSGAGLGGGSSDAAAILRWAGLTSPAEAASLGADVPFCVLGGHAMVSGIGEQVVPLGPAPGTYLLVTPRLHVSTPAVYAAWDALGGPKGDFGNDLEPAALAVAPGLRWWRDVLAAASGERPRLAGSGGTWFLGGSEDRLSALADQIRSDVVAGRESALVEVVGTVPG